MERFVPAGRLAVALLLLIGVSWARVTARAADEPPPRPGNPSPAAAYAVVEAHCARCHEASRLDATASPSGLSNILALDELARDPSLVRPGLPDASPLYTSILRRAMPPPGTAPGAEAKASLSPEELGALRAWIEGLPVPSPCDPASHQATEAARIHKALRALPSETAVRMRFITLPLACAGPSELRGYRAGLTELVRRLAKNDAIPLNETPEVDWLAAIDLERIGWTAAEWDKVAGLYPFHAGNSPTPSPVLRGDWLAHVILTTPEFLGASPDMSATGTERNQRAASLMALARHWERDVSIDQAAVELGLSRKRLASGLAALGSSAEPAVRRLEQGALPRGEFIALVQLLRGGPEAPDGSAAGSTAPALALSLWTDKDAYEHGETVEIHARASADCHLTLIGVEDNGMATVLFPNDLERDNLLPGRTDRRVPGESAPYRLRASGPKHETIVGLCTMPHPLPEGIKPDYDRQRFTSLGDWPTFLADVFTGKALLREAEQPPRRRRLRWARRASPAPKPEPLRPEQHARTAIRFDVR
jgi:mono/diheme cytochrome c family protein